MRKGNFCFIYTFINVSRCGGQILHYGTFICWFFVWARPLSAVGSTSTVNYVSLGKSAICQDTSGKCKTWHRSIKRKVAKMFFSVVISLYVCYIPLWVRAIAYGFNSLKSPQYEFLQFHWFSLIHQLIL